MLSSIDLYTITNDNIETYETVNESLLLSECPRKQRCRQIMQENGVQAVDK